MKTEHSYSAKGVLAALGRSALYLLFFVAVQVLLPFVYGIGIAADAAINRGANLAQGAQAVAERLLDGLSALTLLSCLIIAAVLLLWFLLRKSRYPRRRAFVTARAGRWASAPRRGRPLCAGQSGACPAAGKLDGGIWKSHAPEHRDGADPGACRGGRRAACGGARIPRRHPVAAGTGHAGVDRNCTASGTLWIHPRNAGADRLRVSHGSAFRLYSLSHGGASCPRSPRTPRSTQ